MTFGERFLAAARGWVGAPYCYGARARAGCDCVGLVVGAAREAGATIPDPAPYARIPNPVRLRTELEEHFGEIGPEEEIHPGDVGLFDVRGLALHLGILTGEGTFVHAWEPAGIVAETKLEPWWGRHMVAALRYREAE